MTKQISKIPTALALRCGFETWSLELLRMSKVRTWSFVIGISFVIRHSCFVISSTTRQRLHFNIINTSQNLAVDFHLHPHSVTTCFGESVREGNTRGFWFGSATQPWLFADGQRRQVADRF